MSDFDPNRIYAALIAAGSTWADREAAASLLEETKKTVLAELKNQATGSSDAARETEALAKPEFRLHVTNMVTARRDANRAKVAYDAQKVLGELRRTEQSNLRAEMNIR